MTALRPPLLRSSSYLDAADIIDIKRIAALSDVASSPLDPFASAEQLYTSALAIFEKSPSVFDDARYRRNVLEEKRSEAKIDQDLLGKARTCGVPQAHLPSQRIRSLPRRPPAPVVHEPSNRRASGVSSSLSDQPNPRPSTVNRPPSAPIPSASPLPGTPRSSVSLPTPDRLFKNVITIVPAPNTPRLSTAATTNSVVSLVSSSSASSSARHSYRGGKQKRRDSLMQFFRRDFHPSERPAPVDETTAWDPNASSEGESNSVDQFGRDDRLSVQSASVSSRTSTSSSLDLSSLSWLDRRSLQKPIKSPLFLELQSKCQAEAKRFVMYARRQRVALPLFLGRTRVYMENRIESKIGELRKLHETALEELENRHIEQELQELEAQKVETEENSAKNATALKYVQQRLDLLGDLATTQQLKRLEEEENVLDDLVQRQKRDMRLMLRMQNREKLKLQRHQEKEISELRKELLADYDTKVREKLEELQENLCKLEEQIHDRSIRLVARWHLQLQIFKAEDKEASYIKGPLPLGILGLPEQFGPYIACYF